jgi:hypothetical protein
LIDAAHWRGCAQRPYEKGMTVASSNYFWGAAMV